MDPNCPCCLCKYKVLHSYNIIYANITQFQNTMRSQSVVCMQNIRKCLKIYFCYLYNCDLSVEKLKLLMAWGV